MRPGKFSPGLVVATKGKSGMRWMALAVAAALGIVGNAARADDAIGDATRQFAKLFSDVCMAKFGHLDAVQDWAAAQHLAPVLDPAALAVFAGRPNMDGTMHSFAGGGIPGSGMAWAVPGGAPGHFVLATRDDPESCIVWAQQADPAAVETAYRKAVADATTPGAEVKLIQDKTAAIPDGHVHILVYRVWSGSALTSIALVMAAVSRSGGPFQAMLETQRVIAIDDPINPMVPLSPPVN
jgi:hypothetical protein